MSVLADIATCLAVPSGVVVAAALLVLLAVVVIGAKIIKLGSGVD